MKGKVAATLLATLWAAPAQAADSGPQAMAGSPLRFTFLQEIIATSNALDGPVAISDTIMHLRGTIDGARDTDIGRFEFSGSAEIFEYRDIDFQSDRYANLQLGYAREFTPDFGLRGSLGYAIKDEGDDIAIGPVIFGVRTSSQIFSGGIEAVMRLTPATIATFSVASDYEMVGDSRFTIGLSDLRLLPDRSTTVLGGRLAHQVGNGAVSLTARATAVDLHEMQPGFAAIASDRLRLTAGYETVLRGGLEIGAEAGVTYLRDEFELFERAYPVYTLVAAGPAPGGTQLRLSLRGYVDTLDTDDLLASYIHRGELEIAKPLPYALTVSAGIFGEYRENVVLENEEEAAGVYVALGYEIASGSTMLLRLDYDRRHRTLFDTREETLKGTLGVQFSL